MRWQQKEAFNLSINFCWFSADPFIIAPGLALAQTPFYQGKPSLSFKAVILAAPEICG